MSLKTVRGEGKERNGMEKSILQEGSLKSAVGPGERANRKGEITHGELWEGRPIWNLALQQPLRSGIQ